MELLYFIGIVVGIWAIIRLLYMTIEEIMILLASAFGIFLVLSMIIGFKWSAIMTGIGCLCAILGITIQPSNSHYQSSSKPKKKTYSEKRKEKKAREEAYWQYESDVEDEAISYED